MKHIILLIIFTFSILFAYSQENEDAFQTVKGKVIDKDSKSPIWGAVIVVIDSTNFLAATSDSDGYFTINKIPVGRQNIKVSYMGYEDLMIHNVPVTSEEDIMLTIQMNEKIQNLKEVVIEARIDKDKALNSMASISARSFSIEEAQRYAGGITDPSRMAQAYAGVAATSNDNNEIVVRGNSPRGLLWRIEGMEIPNPNHFREDEGATGGGVCVLSSNVISNSDFFTSAFPAEYGNALSGVFDLNLRKGSDDYYQSSIGVSVVGTEVSVEGPISKKRESSFLINYRYSTFAMLDGMGIKVSNENIIPKFQDFVCNISLPSNNWGHTTIFGIIGASSSGTKANEDSITLLDKTQRFEEYDKGNIWIAGITNNYMFKNKKTSIKTSFTIMGEDNTMSNDTMDFKYNNHNIYNEDLAYRNIRGSFMVNHKFNSKHTARLGFIVSNNYYNLYSSGYNFDEKQNEKIFDIKGNTWVTQSFIEWKYRISSKITMNTGMHYLHFFLNNDHSIEPRLGFIWQLNSKQSISAGVGIHSRMEPISIYLTNIPQGNDSLNQPNKDLKLSKALHAVIGYDYSFSENLHFRAEAYYQYLHNIPSGMGDNDQFSVINLRYGFVTMPLNNGGKGRNMGLDITFERYFTNAYYFMITGSLYDSRYTPNDGNTYNTTFNGNYIFNALAGKEWALSTKKNKILGVNARFLYRGGMRYQGVDIAASNLAGHVVYYKDENYTQITSDVYNINIGVNFKCNLHKYSWLVSLDLNNLTNQKNIIKMKYEPYTGSVKYTYDLLLLPILSFKLNF